MKQNKVSRVDEHKHRVVARQKLSNHQSCVDWSIVMNVLYGTIVSLENWSMVFQRSSSISHLIWAMFASFFHVERLPERGMSSVDKF
ncbi:hypothetical protein TNCV_1293631 [Trichonephila clavipes]|nr:hypothetical protein TNCV_1293631 [Trichonephila clavipes]